MGQTIDIFRQTHFSSPTTALTTSPNPLSIDGGWEIWILTHGLWTVIFVLGFLALLFLKLFIGIYLLKFARNRMSSVPRREEKERQWDEGARKTLNKGKGTPGGVEIEDRVRGLLDRGEDDLLGMDRGDKGKGLLRVERYSMVSKRIW
jgi:hypothetical protein